MSTHPTRYRSIGPWRGRLERPSLHRFLGAWLVITTPVVTVVTHDAEVMACQLAAGLALLGLPRPSSGQPAT